MSDRLTSEVADLLSQSYHRVFGLVRGRQIRPRRDASGRYWWRPADVRRARELLAKGERARATAER